MARFQQLSDGTREVMYPDELVNKVVTDLAGQGYETTVYSVENEGGIDVVRALASSVLTPEEQQLYALPAGKHVLGGGRLLLPEPHYEDGNLVLPLEHRGRKVILHVQGVGRREVRDFLRLGEGLAVSFYNAFDRDQLRYEKEHDLPTGLFNKQRFLDTLDESFSIARNEGAPLAVLMFDIDWFKALNTRYGHARVDRHILKPYADLLNANTSRSRREKRPVGDMLARYGGEEFVWCGFTDLNGAYVVGERFRSLTERASFYIPGNNGDCEYNRFTTSGGIATYPSDAKEPLELLDKAIEALIYAKSHGRRAVYALVDSRFRRSPLNPPRQKAAPERGI